MLFFGILVVGLLPAAMAQKVVGSAKGFAAGVTGGGNATPQVPSSISQYDSPKPIVADTDEADFFSRLKSWLSDSTARVIVLDKVRIFFSHSHERYPPH